MMAKLIERQAKDLLKDVLKSGHIFEGSHSVRDFLIAQLNLKPRLMAAGKAARLIREVRYELRDDGISMTNPIPANGFRHEAYANAEQRLESRRNLKNHWKTRTNNLLADLSTDAAQSDATDQERRDQKVLEAISLLIDTVS